VIDHGHMEVINQSGNSLNRWYNTEIYGSPRSIAIDGPIQKSMDRLEMLLI